MDAPVLIAIVSALSVLFGVVISQGVAMFQSWLDRRNKREILLRTKYEELGQHFLASTEKPARLLKCKTHEEIEDAILQSEAKQAQLLALIYFPPLRDPLQRYVSSYQNLCLAVTELYYQRPEGKKVGEVVYNHPNYHAARNAHIADKENLATQIEIHAVTYTKS